MSKLVKLLWHTIKRRGEDRGLPFLILGCLCILLQFVLVLTGLRAETSLLGVAFGLISVGLGFTAIGMGTKSDKRHTDLLERLDKNVARLPLLLKDDMLTPSGQLLAKELLGDQSKSAARKRLDEDTKKVGYVRGEIYEVENGRWAIHWGGKYPL